MVAALGSFGMRSPIKMMLLLLPASAAAATPALWIQEQANCHTDQIDRARALHRGKFTTQDARRAATSIVRICRSTVPPGLSTAQERADMDGADRYEIARKLRNEPRPNVR